MPRDGFSHFAQEELKLPAKSTANPCIAQVYNFCDAETLSDVGFSALGLPHREAFMADLNELNKIVQVVLVFFFSRHYLLQVSYTHSIFNIADHCAIRKTSSLRESQMPLLMQLSFDLKTLRSGAGMSFHNKAAGLYLATLTWSLTLGEWKPNLL